MERTRGKSYKSINKLCFSNEKLKKLLKKGGVWYTMVTSGKKVVISGRKWSLRGLRLQEGVLDVTGGILSQYR